MVLAEQESEKGVQEKSIKYPLTFRAAILERHHMPLELDQVTFNGPLQPGQILVRIHYSGICGKQIEEINGLRGEDPYLPHMLGHEGSGVVVDIGPAVTKVVPGDHVVLHWMKGKGIEAAVPIYERGKGRVNAGWITTFNKYGVISENRMTPIPQNVDLKLATLLGCSVISGLGSVWNDVNVRPGESIAVFGCGGVGLNAVQGAALVHAYPIIAVDKNPSSLELALRLGATHALRFSDGNGIKVIKQLTNHRGANHVIVATGDPEVIEVAVTACAAPGKVLLVGVPPVGSKITVDPFSIHFQRKLLGCYGGSMFPDSDISRCLDLHSRGVLKLEELISCISDLDEINTVTVRMRTGVPGRCLVRMCHD